MSQEPKSMEDTLRETYAAMETEDVEDTSGVDAPAKDVVPTPKEEVIKVKSYKRRKSNTDERVDQRTPSEAEGDSTHGEPSDRQEGSSDQPLESSSEIPPLPGGWRGAVKEQWENLPNEVRNEIIKRESDVQKFVSQRGEAAAFGDSLWAEFAPYEQMLRSEGASPQAAVKELLKTAAILRSNDIGLKTRLIAELAQRYGADLEAIQQGQLPQVDPAVARLEQMYVQMNQTLQQQGTAYQAAEDQRLRDEIETFKGQPGREHFDVVASRMAGILQRGEASTLEQAYDQAVWASPDTRQAMLKSQKDRSQADAQAQALKAKQAASVNVQKRGTVATGTSTTGSIEDTLRTELARLTG